MSQRGSRNTARRQAASIYRRRLARGTDQPVAAKGRTHEMNSITTMKTHSLSALIAIWFINLCLIISQHAGAQQPSYILIDLNNLAPNATSSQAVAINNKGQVIVQYSLADGTSHGLIFSGGIATDIPGLGGADTTPYSINDNGQVVGDATLPPDQAPHAFLYSGAITIDLNTLPGCNCSYALGINNRGITVGFAGRGLVVQTPFILSGNTMVPINIPGVVDNSNVATSVNNNGQVVGDYAPDFYTQRAFLYLPLNNSITDIGTLGGPDTWADAINNSGDIVGMSMTSSSKQAFLYSKGVMIDLSAYDTWNSSEAMAINDFGQVVGTFSPTPTSLNHAFLYLDHNTYDLNNLLVTNPAGWTLTSAAGINNVRQIVGTMEDAAGRYHAFLLSPINLEALQTGVSHPPYGNGITQLPGKDSLVVITHGLIPPWKDTVADTAWVDSMSNSISQCLNQHLPNTWQVEGHKWIQGAHIPWMTSAYGFLNALNNARMDGINLAYSIIMSGNWAHVHLIGHSAGAELTQACSEVLKAQWGDACVIHCTFLDPFTGLIPLSLVNNVSVYGDSAHWSDNYFTRDQETGGDAWPATEGPLDHAYSVDVTHIDPHKIPLMGYAPVVSGLGTSCVHTETSHGWPIDFYSNTITGRVTADYQNFGFPLSEEGSSWNLTQNYNVGNDPPIKLGTSDPDCIQVFDFDSGSTSGPLDLSDPSMVQIEMGVVARQHTGVTLTKDDPAWLACSIFVTNALNYVAFDAQFTGDPGAAGQFSAYWDTNAIGFADETLIGTAARHYVLSFQPATSNSVHVLGFRIDSSSALPSSICVTNIFWFFRELLGKSEWSGRALKTKADGQLEGKG